MAQLSSKSYNFTAYDEASNPVPVSLKVPGEVEALAQRARNAYDVSKRHIDGLYRDQWRAAKKSYYLSTRDRRTVVKSWQSNVPFGLVRESVDVFESDIAKDPFAFTASAYDEAGLKNKENVIDALSYAAEASNFRDELLLAASDGLNLGTFGFRVHYLKNSPTQRSYWQLIDGIPVETTYEDDGADWPAAKCVDPFKIFPDPYVGPLRWVVERDVVPMEDFLRTFGALIDDADNKSPFAKYVKFLGTRQNSSKADLSDFGNVVAQVFQDENDQERARDSFEDTQTTGRTNAATVGSSPDMDQDVQDGLVEFHFETRNESMVLLLNGFPVVVMKNKWGFVPYVIKPADGGRTRFGVGMHYMLKGFERIGDSFLNNLVDSARAVAVPTFVAKQNALINQDALEDSEPGKTLYVDGDTNEAIRRLDKGSVSDNGIIDLVKGLSSGRAGISEYNRGESAGERTASGANSLTNYSLKRLGKFMNSMVSAVSEVAGMWLKLMRLKWTEERFVRIVGDGGAETFKMLSTKDMVGNLRVSVRPDGMFANINDANFQRLLSVYNALAPSGFTDAPEIGKQLLKAAGIRTEAIVDTNKIKPDDAVAQQTNNSTPAITPENAQSPESMAASQSALPTSPQDQAEGQLAAASGATPNMLNA